MTSVFSAFAALFKTNHFTGWFVFFLLGVSLLKYLPLRVRVPEKTLLVAILVLGAALRVAWLGYSSHVVRTAWDPTHMLESDVANVHAVELAQKGVWFHDAAGHPSGRRPIGYPLFLAALYKIFGTSTAVAWASHVALYAATAWLVYAIGAEIFGPGVGLAAAFFFSVYPVSIYSVKLTTDEHLFLPVWFAGLYLLVLEAKGRRIPAAWLWYGLLFGYAAMTRTHAIFMPAVVGLVYFLLKRSWKEVVGAAVAVALVMQLLNLPWAIRNYRAWHVPVLYTATGFYVYSQVNDTADAKGGGHVPREGEPGYSKELDDALAAGNEGLAHRIANRQMKKWILAHPAKFAAMGAARVLLFMGWNRDGVWPIWFQFYPGSYDPARPIPQKARDFFEEAAYFFYYALFFASAAGAFLAFRRRRALGEPSRVALCALGACFAFWWAEHTIIYPDRKYRFPLEPLMIVFACFFLEWLARDFRWERLFRKGSSA